MDQTGAAHTVVRRLRVGPVADPGQRRRAIGRDADADQALRCAVVLVTPEEVEHGSAGPRADDDVGQQRVQRVAEPGAAEGVLERTGIEDGAHPLAYRLADGVESLRGLNRRYQGFDWCRPTRLPVSHRSPCDTRDGTPKAPQPTPGAVAPRPQRVAQRPTSMDLRRPLASPADRSRTGEVRKS